MFWKSFANPSTWIAAAGHVGGVVEARRTIQPGVAGRTAERFHGMRRTRAYIQVQVRMRLEWLGRVLIRLLIDSLMACRATVHTRNGLEGLVVVKVGQDDLIDALRRIHEIEHRRIAERNNDGAGIERIQTGFQARVIRQHLLALFFYFVVSSVIFVVIFIRVF